MKSLRLPILFILTIGLLAGASHAFAVPADALANLQGTVTPGAVATDMANRLATLQALQRKGKPEHFIGTISAVDSTSLTLTLRDASSVTLILTPNTRAFAIGPEGRPRPANLAPGQVVLVRAFRDDTDALVVRSLLVMPTKPVRVHLIGTVTEYTPGVSITIQVLDGKSYTLIIDGRTNVLPPNLAGSLAVGSRVTIVAPRDPASGQATALGIVVLP